MKKRSLFLIIFVFFTLSMPESVWGEDLFDFSPYVRVGNVFFASGGGGLKYIELGGGYALPLTRSGIDLQISGAGLYNHMEETGGIGWGVLVRGRIFQESYGIPMDLSWMGLFSMSVLTIKLVLTSGGALSVGKTFYTPDGKISIGPFLTAGVVVRYREEWAIGDRDFDPDFYGSVGMMFNRSASFYRFSFEVRFTEVPFFLLNWYFP